MRDSLRDALERAEGLTLQDTVPIELVQQVALRYASELPLTGGIAELAGGVARAVHAHPGFDDAVIGDLLPADATDTIVDKLLELPELRQTLVHTVLGSTELHALAAQWLHEALTARLGVLRRLSPAALTATIDETFAAILGTATTRMAGNVEAALGAADTERWRDVLAQCTDALRALPLAPIRDQLGDDDIEDLVALGFAFWQQHRTTALYRELISTGIEAVYARFGAMPLAALLRDLGISEDMLLAEARRFAPPVLATLRDRGILEDLLRFQLAGFYASADFAEAIAANTQAPD